MPVTNYLRILRQRWLLVLTPCLVALLVAFFTLPEEDAGGPVVTNYEATSTLITSATAPTDQEPLSLATVALYVTTGEIPQLAAEQLDYDGEPQVLASEITVEANPETSTLTITSNDSDGEAAAERVNTFAQTTIDFFTAEQQRNAQERTRELNRQLDVLTTQLAELDQPSAASDPTVEGKRAALNGSVTAVAGELASIDQAAGGADLLSVLQPGVPVPLATQTFAAPSNPLVRVGIAGLLGLLLGAALAMVVERLDSRMRTREQVEEATGLPVLAEIPLLSTRQRTGVVSASRPASVAAESFRTLRSSVLLSPGVVGASKAGRGHESLVLLVSSALPGAGKTTTAANLAAVMAEAGRRVLLLSLDLRNPTLHQHFNLPNGTGISELLSADRGRHLKEVVHQTDVPGVSIATSGHDTDHPGAILASVRPLIAAARTLADVVIIDAPPMLVVSDALDVGRHADVTLLVNRLNKTTYSQAEECQRLFHRLGVPALGSVLVGSRRTGASYGYPTVRTEPAQSEDTSADRPQQASTSVGDDDDQLVTRDGS